MKERWKSMPRKRVSGFKMIIYNILSGKVFLITLFFGINTVCKWSMMHERRSWNFLVPSDPWWELCVVCSSKIGIGLWTCGWCCVSIKQLIRQLWWAVGIGMDMSWEGHWSFRLRVNVGKGGWWQHRRSTLWKKAWRFCWTRKINFSDQSGLGPLIRSSLGWGEYLWLSLLFTILPELKLQSLNYFIHMWWQFNLRMDIYIYIYGEQNIF